MNTTKSHLFCSFLGTSNPKYTKDPKTWKVQNNIMIIPMKIKIYNILHILLKHTYFFAAHKDLKDFCGDLSTFLLAILFQWVSARKT